MPVAAALLLCFASARAGRASSRADALRAASPRPGRPPAARRPGHLRHPLVDGVLELADPRLRAGLHAADPALARPRGADARLRSPASPSPASASSCSFPTSCSAATGRPSAGDLVLLVAASFFSYYTVAAKPLIERLGGVTVMTYAVLLGSAAGGRAQPARRPRRALERGRAGGLGRHVLRRASSRPSSAGWSGAGSTRCAASPAPRR